MHRGRPRHEAPRSLIHATAVGFFLLIVGCGSEPGNGPDVTAARSGEELAQTYCSSCHQLPEPSLLTKSNWEHDVLPHMALFLGIYEDGRPPDSLFEDGVGGELVKEANIFPRVPVLQREQWEAIRTYYLDEAPSSFSPREDPEVTVGLDHFNVRVPDFRINPPMTSLVQVDTVQSLLYVGDVKTDYSTISLLNQDGAMVERLAPLMAPTHVEWVADTLFVLEAGRLLPTDAPSGRLMKLFRLPGETRYGAMTEVLDNLHRPVHFVRADLNNDGRTDWVVSEFGRHVGRLSWFEMLSSGVYERHVLVDRPGAIRAEVRDLDGDGRLDIIALMAQGDERIIYFSGREDGRFDERTLLRFPPSYGSTSFDLVDLNGDGNVDLLYTNGDNGDYIPPLPKPYHGVRGFLNDGTNNFEEAFFYPLDGAYGATAADFDDDGDVDIAAIAFYSAYHATPGESFVYLENTGDLKFSPSTFSDHDAGRWMVIDEGDVDGDSDQDLVLGSFVGLLEAHIPDSLQRRWIDESPSLLILENTTE